MTADAVSTPPIEKPVKDGQVVVVTGLSGAGKTASLKMLEDLGFEAVDNLPLSLLSGLILSQKNQNPRLAIGVDARTRDFDANAVLAMLDTLRRQTRLDVQLIYLDCDNDVLTRRFTETRRRHPLATDRPLLDGINHERTLIAPLLHAADLVIDTTSLPPSNLGRILAASFGPEDGRGLLILVTSFAYPKGLPREADLVFDARFLRNPHYVEDLRAQDGRSVEVATYVAEDPLFEQYFVSLTTLLSPLLPRFAAEGKSYLTIAVGCTGGRHRSVYVAERLNRWLLDQGARVKIRHRELEG